MLALVVVGLIAYKWTSAQSARKEAAAWDAAFSSMAQGDTAGLDQIAEDYSGTMAAQWAAVVAADLQLAAGCQDLFTTKATAADQFQKVQEKYTEVLKSSRVPAIRECATFGLARTYESMAGTRRSQEDLARATEEYAKVVKEWPNGAYAKLAQTRLSALEQTSTMQFYDALAAWEPRPPVSSPSSLDSLNIPFDESGKGLEVGEQPKELFGTSEGTAKPPAEGEAAGQPETPAPKADSPEAPAMPAATGDKPAEKPEKSAEQTKTPAVQAEKSAEQTEKPAEQAKKPAEQADKPAEQAEQPAK